MISVISNDSVLRELWDWALENYIVTEKKARIRGVGPTSKHASIPVHIWLGVGSQSASAYCQLECVRVQRKSFSEAEGLSLAAITFRTLKSMRANVKFALFCKDVTTYWQNVMS